MDQRGDLSRQVFTVYYNFIFQGKMGAGSWEELVQVSISIIKLETHEYFNTRSRRDCKRSPLWSIKIGGLYKLV
jgi:hypothetical protein